MVERVVAALAGRVQRGVGGPSIVVVDVSSSVDPTRLFYEQQSFTISDSRQYYSTLGQGCIKHIVDSGYRPTSP